MATATTRGHLMMMTMAGLPRAPEALELETTSAIVCGG
tara:strand:- start:576 stop:689 length:114 start_codon:yes stop_codon:yes gene_type:complete